MECKRIFPRWVVTAIVMTPLLFIHQFLFAHQGDPKAKLRTPYTGPGFRLARAAGSGAPVPFGPPGFASLNVTLLSWLPLYEFGTGITTGADCWGYISASGREYAIFTHGRGTAFVEITDPSDAQVVGEIDGPDMLWRDVKVYQNHAYVVSEGGSGIQVVDLSGIDNGVVTLVGTVTSGGDPTTHNVAIDESSGFLYRCGGGDNGLRCYDLADPAAPVYVGEWPDRYVHDAQVVTYVSGPFAGRQIAFCCAGFNGGFVEPGLDIVDVTDKQNPVLVERVSYQGGRYSHQAWLSDDRRYLYLNDELDEGALGIPTRTTIFDVTDISNPVEISTFTNGNNAVGHNLYVLGDLIYEANYRSGLRVFDASNPLAPVEAAYYDTYPDDDNAQFDGLWSVYPFFPSGTVIGSDIDRGLFVWDVTYSTLPPVAFFGASPTSGSLPLEVQFTDFSTGSVTSHDWDFGDGTTSMEGNPIHIYDTSGTYTVSLTVAGPAGSATFTQADFIEVGPPAHILGVEDQTALAGSVFPVPVRGGSAVFLGGFSVSIAYPEDLLDGIDFTLAGSVTESNGAEFVETQIDDIEGAMTIEVVMDLPPLDGHSIPAGTDHTLASLVFDVNGSFVDGATRALSFVDGLGPSPVDNQFIDLGGVGFPPTVLDDGVLTFRHQVLFIRSDCDGTGALNIADPILLLGVLFSGATPPSCLKACDFDDSGLLNLADSILALQLLFQAGIAPPAPFPEPGVDPTPDALPCG